MPRRRKILILLALTISAAAMVLFLMLRTQEEVTYRHRSLSYWFTQLPVTPVLFPPENVYSVNVVGFMDVRGQQYGSTALGDANTIDALQFFVPSAVRSR